MISMIANKTELYDLLWRDYFDLHNKNASDSFIYNYLRHNKDKRAENIAKSRNSLCEYATKKKLDKYILLRAAYLAYSNGTISENEYLEYFSNIASVKDRKTGEAKLPKCCALDSPDGIKASQEYQECKLLKGCVSDFFQNAGYRRDTTKNDEYFSKTNIKYTKEKEGYINDLDLWAAYYMYSMEQSTEKDGHYIPQLDSEYIEKCKKLFSLLDNEQYSEAFVPLYFDTASGAGVFIIGKERFEEADSEGCCVCTAHFGGLMEKISTMSELPFSMLTTVYDNVDDAFFALKKGIADGGFCANYSLENNEPPAGADSCFNSYFYISEQELRFSSDVNKRFAERESIDFQTELEEEQRRMQRMQSTVC